MKIFTVTVYHLSGPKTKHLIYAQNAIEAKYIVLNHFGLVDEQIRHIEVKSIEVTE